MLTALIFLSGEVMSGDTICVPVKSSGEGNWPIPESQFTFENAKEAVRKLELLINQSMLEADDFMSKNHNLTVIIDGYLRKKHIAELEAINSKNTERFKKYFCEFLKDEAYISH